MKKWAATLAPEHWRHRVESLVSARVAEMIGEIHKLAQAAVKTTAIQDTEAK